LFLSKMKSPPFEYTHSHFLFLIWLKAIVFFVWRTHYMARNRHTHEHEHKHKHKHKHKHNGEHK
jgi:hypothetical protein